MGASPTGGAVNHIHTWVQPRSRESEPSGFQSSPADSNEESGSGALTKLASPPTSPHPDLQGCCPYTFPPASPCCHMPAFPYTYTHTFTMHLSHRAFAYAISTSQHSSWFSWLSKLFLFIYFAVLCGLNKGLYSQNYSFPSSHVQM